MDAYYAAVTVNVEMARRASSDYALIESPRTEDVGLNQTMWVQIGRFPRTICPNRT